MRRRVLLGGVLLVVVAVAYCVFRTDSDGVTKRASIAQVANRTRATTTTRNDHAAITGNVTDSAKSALVGVRVCAVLYATSSCAVTDARGHYQILDLRAAKYIVRAGLPRHVLPHQQVVQLHAFEVRTVDLVMRAGGIEISGTVSDLGGGPIANASVTASGQMSDETTAPVETDVHGEYHMWVSTSAAYIFASADGYVDATEMASPPSSTDVFMIPEATLVGTVIDARTKQPVADADVTLLHRDYRVSSEKSDEHGRFEFRKLEFGRYTAEARDVHGYGVADGSVAVAIGQHLDGVVVELQPAASIVGKAMISGTAEQPCAKARVVMIRNGEYLNPDVAADGTFRIDGLSPGSYNPSVECLGYAQLGKVAEIEVGTDDVSRTWRFGEGAILRGHVRDSSGGPMAGVEVEARSYPNGGSDISKADGEYEIRGLAPDSYFVSAHAEHATSASGDQASVKIGEKAVVDHDLVLIANGAISGVVVDRDGHPLAGVKMILNCRNGYPAATTGSDGTFRFESVPIDDVDVMADLGIETVRQTTTVRSNATSDIRFVVDAGATTVSGIVLDELGRPAPDVLVMISREHAHPTWDAKKFETGTDGHFAFSSLPDGLYKLEAMRGGSPTVSVDDVAANTVTTLRFEPTSSIAGHVRNADGTPLTDFTISVTRGDTDVRSERFFKNGGRYHLDDLPPGTFDLAVVSATSGEGHLALELAKGQRRDNVDLTIDASLVVTGRVIDLVSHQPIARISVYARVQGRGQGQRGTTDSDGRFAITGLAHGPLSVEVYQTGFTSSELRRPAPTASTVDVGDIAIAKDRYVGQPLGTLGLSISEDRTIDAFEADSSGLKAGLVAGDVITTIDGLDVTSATGRVVYALTIAPVGTTIRIGVARGGTVAATTK